MKFALIEAEKAEFPIAFMCRQLGVSRSGYYAWRSRPRAARSIEDERLSEKIVELHRRSRKTYGSPRIMEDLREEGIRVGRKRVARLMVKAEVRGVCRRRRKVHTTVRCQGQRPAPDLVQRDFTAQEPNQLWVADITYVPTDRGFLYLAVVLDAFSRRIVGWAMETHLRTELVLGALDMALEQRRPQAVVHHSDQGCQYTSVEFGARCRKNGVQPSMGSVGDCYDNAMCESFFATLETELLDRHTFADPAEARTAVFDFIEGWYNPHRRHSSIGYKSPVAFERALGGVQAGDRSRARADSSARISAQPHGDESGSRIAEGDERSELVLDALSSPCDHHHP